MQKPTFSVKREVFPDPSPSPRTPPPAPSSTRQSPPVSPHKPPPVSPAELRSAGTISTEVYLSDRDWSEFQRSPSDHREEGACRVGGSREGAGTGGRSRPPLATPRFDELLEAYRWKQRVCARAAAPRKVDESRRPSPEGLLRPHPFGWLAPFPALDRMVVQTFPSYRPPRRLHAIAGFCENGLLRPTWSDGEEWIIDDATPAPTRIPEYHYLRGNLGYRPLDQEATLAA